MSSLAPAYEYDVFISYRHNDNLDRWVSEFVENLERELKSTIKNSLSVYFDKNSHDGLLETHSVDKSLEGKLKSVILIPIISQTYCDSRSFAWQHEFCAFCATSKNDNYGRYVRLADGNVACRILPVKIHEIDDEDTELLERHLEGSLRAIEFIYREPGVNRPLKISDSRTDNLNRTDYRNQINKMAIAIKEILSAIVKPGSPAPAKKNSFVPEPIDARPSLAVLPFSNLSRNAEQEYLSDGIAENIISELASHRAFRVISRTSVMRYKKTTQSASEIASELKVKYILEGGVQISGSRMRINIQLANAQQDDILWSKVFQESLDDIFTVQSKVSEAVVSHLQQSFEPSPKPGIEKQPTQNQEAYNLFLKGRHAFNQWNVEGYKSAAAYFEKALELDPDFAQAYSYLASCYSARMSWNGDLSPGEAVGQIEKYLAEAWRREPSTNDYITKAFMAFFVDKDFTEAEKLLLRAIDLKPNEASALYTYSYVLNMMGRHEEAKSFVSRAALIDPLTVAFFNYSVITDYLLRNYRSALATLDEAIRLYPQALRLYDHLARLHLTQQNWEDAENALMSALQRTSLRPPSMIAFLAIASFALKKTDKAESLRAELEKRSEAGEKGVNVYLMHIYNFLDDTEMALKSLEKARATNDIDLIWFDIDPLLRPLRERSAQGARSSAQIAGS
jgi:TolB-like protein